MFEGKLNFMLDTYCDFYCYRCAVHVDIYKVHSATNALFIKTDKVLKFTLKITLTCSYMFRSTTVKWQRAAIPPHNK